MKQLVKRRTVLVASTAVAAAAATANFPTPAISQQRREWIMISTFPKGSPGLQQSGEAIARSIEALSEGRLRIKTYGAGELVPALETFDAVRQNKAQMGNSMPYYWTGKDKLAAFFSAAPGGLTAEEQNAWIYHGGGQELWDELYANYGLKGFVTGSFGSQQLGWFTKPVKSLQDIKGLKIRITGIAGEVMDRLGASSTLIPIGEVMTALQSGTLDAAEFLGGWADLAFGFPKVVKNFYGPGFHEPGSTEEMLVNLDEWKNLPANLKLIVDHACRAENARHSAQFTYHDAMALRKIVDDYKVNVAVLPDDVLLAMFKVSRETVAEIGNSSPFARKVYDSWSKFRSARIQFGDLQTLGFSQWRAKAEKA